ncbi:uncharacterized protein TNCV_1915591 [Trichonephila clavipes]|uniref:Uncharacterized protein n=1 Tax=Trichonephila clavipes TaxID=2585209 RepID=A0A8X6W0E2_TRICX|nr:uncharacterized protein TNCV_1915591 [Trichonephila clavipes]
MVRKDTGALNDFAALNWTVANEAVVSTGACSMMWRSSCHTPSLALHTTVAGKFPSSPEDEQEKQEESRGRCTYGKSGMPTWRVILNVGDCCDDKHTTNFGALRWAKVIYRLIEFPIEESEPNNFIWQQDGAPPHWHLSVRDWVNITVPNQRIGRKEPLDKV